MYCPRCDCPFEPSEDDTDFTACPACGQEIEMEQPTNNIIETKTPLLRMSIESWWLERI